MKPMVYNERMFPMTLKQLHAIETTCGAELPADARDYLISSPGTWPSRDMFRKSGKSFTDFRLGSMWDYPEGRLIVSPDSKCFIFASARRNALLGIELSKLDYGAIYFCEKSRGTPGKRLDRVASNLFALLDMLEEDPDTDFWEHHNYRYCDECPEWLLDTYRTFEPYMPTMSERLSLSDPSKLPELDLKNSGPKISPEFFEWVELAFRIRLPLDLKQFYSLHNGGRPSKQLFKWKPYPINADFVRWEHPDLSLRVPPQYGEFEIFTKKWKYEEKVLPAQMWPLAWVDAGRILAFSTAQGHFGTVWLAYVDLPQLPLKIADSFSEFVNGVWELPTDDQLYDLPGQSR